MGEKEEVAGYGALRRSYLFPYFMVISYGLFIYCTCVQHVDVLKELAIMGTSSVSKPYSEMRNYLSTYIIPFYVGMIFSCILDCPKRDKSLIFSFIMTLGALTLVAEYKLKWGFSLGIILTNFAGGFFDSIVPSFLFEVSPKESFPVAGTIAYLGTSIVHFVVIVILYLARWINEEHRYVIALTIGLVLSVVPLACFPFYTSTPIELAREQRKDECRKELERMYNTEYGVRRRYGDIQNVLRLTDRYNVSIFKMVTLPPMYRNALFVGIGVGLSQGLINSFFENYICKIIDNDTTFLYCASEALNLNSGFAYLLFLSILVIAPVFFFLFYLERYGRSILFIFGMGGTIVVLLIIIVFTLVQKYATISLWPIYIVQGIIMFYSIIVYSATLGPCFMIYVPEILPIPGVTIAIVTKTLGKMGGDAILKLEVYSPFLMLFFTVLYVVFYVKVIKETKWLTDMELHVLYMKKEDREALVERIQRDSL
eukprot:TRINITY_DN4085_c0_g4_i1.p1 TRINITY_DN4085_c0_g4~~TRINITY_DN4085_c0_g4_i1.p1  ORF type:complete len:483 (-),score=121.79 TRINITY_DN4085_c0_g4_i1:121-1569(-)